MNITKKILISDFDYTLYDHDNPSNTAENLLAVTRWRRAGNLFIVATGRNLTSLRLTFPNYRDYVDYLVLNDGATVIRAMDGEVLHRDIIKEKIVTDFTAELRQANFANDYAVIGYYGDKELNVIKPNCYKFRLWFKTQDDCMIAEDILSTKFERRLHYYSYHSVDFNFDARLDWINDDMKCVIEVNLAGTNKKTGLSALFDKLNIGNKHTIIAVGDDQNDICMLEAYDGYFIGKTREDIRRRLPGTAVVPYLHILIANQLKALA